MLIGLAAVAVVPSGPLWWAPLLPTVGMFAKAIESAACAVLYLHESGLPEAKRGGLLWSGGAPSKEQPMLSPQVRAVVGLSGGVSTAVKIWIPPLMLVLLALALLHKLLYQLPSDATLSSTGSPMAATTTLIAPATVRYKPKSVLILSSFGVAALGAVTQLAVEHRDDSSYATGPLVLFAFFFYVITNYCCANAVYLYPKHLPLPVKVVCWCGLLGGGVDHAVETLQWAGVLTPRTGFGMHCVHWIGYEFIPLLGFAATSLIGI